ncbi:maleylpyruvate isomerase family mycothiol-dependent enzyme [Nocardia sp. CA-135953]|uniref:maleylpyruvate isomerase family mycothiol-dependent enzyme n=1 Tax=Nocardia sp. CA-135953 TaxID=3239978 RepID=UPI003D97E12A
MEFDELELDERLLIARSGTAYFAQCLAELSDRDLDGDTLLPGWTRRHLLAHVGYNAAALCRLLDWAATGIETPMYASTEQRAREIDEGATLGPAALRNLFSHNVARLDERWRDLPARAWTAQVRTAQGRTVPAVETSWMRTREVWIHAVDLASGGRFGDFPTVVLDSLLTDIIGVWHRKDLGTGLVLAVDGRAARAVSQDSPATNTVSGPLAGVVRWATGRGAAGVQIQVDGLTPPSWL